MSQEATVAPVTPAIPAIVEMQSPTEKDGFQLDTINNYGTKIDGSNGLIDEENNEQALTSDGDGHPVSIEHIVDDDTFIDPDQLGIKEKLLLRLFPWLLRWPWFKKKILKKKKPDDKCKNSTVTMTIVCINSDLITCYYRFKHLLCVC